jgi:hypothetical protein
MSNNYNWDAIVDRKRDSKANSKSKTTKIESAT